MGAWPSTEGTLPRQGLAPRSTGAEASTWSAKPAAEVAAAQVALVPTEEASCEPAPGRALSKTVLAVLAPPPRTAAPVSVATRATATAASFLTRPLSCGMSGASAQKIPYGADLRGFPSTGARARATALRA